MRDGIPVRSLLASAALLLTLIAPAAGQSCVDLLEPMRAGLSDRQIARIMGLSMAEVGFCRRELQRPMRIGPAGPSPQGAAGPPPFGAVGPPPFGAMGPPPFGAAGPSPAGTTLRRLK